MSLHNLSNTHIFWSYIYSNRPSILMHEDWISKMFDAKYLDVLRGTLSDKKLHKYLSNNLLNKGLIKATEFNMLDHDGWKLAALDSSYLEILARYLGALELGQNIRSIISGSDLQLLKENIGEELVYFVYHRHAAYKGLGNIKHKDTQVESIISTYEILGWKLLMHVKSLLPKSCQYLWEYRAPIELDLYYDMSGIQSKLVYSAALLLIKRLDIFD